MTSKPKPETIRIELTEQQQRKVQEITGRKLDEVELSVMELEERIAPALSRN
jgi:hypothetical protein